MRVMPLLNVHRTEEQLKIANEELLCLRAKLERIENDRNELKTENQKLEAKVCIINELLFYNFIRFLCFTIT